MGFTESLGEATHPSSTEFSSHKEPTIVIPLVPPATKEPAPPLSTSVSLIEPLSQTDVFIHELVTEGSENQIDVTAEPGDQPFTSSPRKRTRTPFPHILDSVKNVVFESKTAGMWGLPTTSCLAEQIGCSRDSVAKAFQALVVEGLVEFTDNHNGYRVAGYDAAHPLLHVQTVSIPERDIWIEITPPEERARLAREKELRWLRENERRWRALFPQKPEPIYVQMPLPSEPPEYEQIPLKKPGAYWRTISTILQDQVQKGIIAGKFPSNQELAKRFTCSTRLIELAKKDLANSGLLEFHSPRMGYYVRGSLPESLRITSQEIANDLRMRLENGSLDDYLPTHDELRNEYYGCSGDVLSNAIKELVAEGLVKRCGPLGYVVIGRPWLL